MEWQAGEQARGRRATTGTKSPSFMPSALSILTGQTGGNGRNGLPCSQKAESSCQSAANEKERRREAVRWLTTRRSASSSSCPPPQHSETFILTWVASLSTLFFSFLPTPSTTLASFTPSLPLFSSFLPSPILCVLFLVLTHSWPALSPPTKPRSIPFFFRDTKNDCFCRLGMLMRCAALLLWLA